MPVRSRTRRSCSRPSRGRRRHLRRDCAIPRTALCGRARGAWAFGPGEVVSSMLPNGVAAAGVFLGAMHGGYVASPISLLAQDALDRAQRSRTRRRASCLRAPEFVERLAAIVAQHRQRARSFGRPRRTGFGVACDEFPRDTAAVPDASPALLMYTSGTTGTPKGAALAREPDARRALRSREAHRADAGRSRARRRCRSITCNGQCIATISPLVSGGSIVMPHRFSVSQWWPLVERYRPTWLNVVPTIIAYLINGADRSTPRRRRVPRRSLRALGVRAAAARAASRVRGALRHFGARGDGTDRMRVGRVRESARSARTQDRLARSAARHGGARRRAPTAPVLGDGEPAKSSCAATT